MCRETLFCVHANLKEKHFSVSEYRLIVANFLEFSSQIAVAFILTILREENQLLLSHQFFNEIWLFSHCVNIVEKLKVTSASVCRLSESFISIHAQFICAKNKLKKTHGDTRYVIHTNRLIPLIVLDSEKFQRNQEF